MNRTMLSLLAAYFVFGSSHALAMPQFGRNCRDCHVGGPPPVVGAMEVINFNGLVDPDESATGATDRGILKFLEVEAGASVDLSVLVDFQDVPDVLYAVELKRMETTGVEGGGTLVYTPDPDWFFQIGTQNVDADRPYFTIPAEEGIAFTDPQVLTFTMLVDGSTDPDFYDLEFAIAGQPGFFYGDEHFYLHVVPEPASFSLMVLAIGVMKVRRRRSACAA